MKRLISAGVLCAALLASTSLHAQDAPAITNQGANPGEQDEPKTGVILLAPSEGQIFTVDEDGRIYEKRGYKGVVPGMRDQPGFPAKQPAPIVSGEEVPVVVSWIGFQPYESFSRVFIQMTGDFEYSVTRPAPLRIEVSLPRAKPGSENDLNGLITRWFPTNVDRVEVRPMKKAYEADPGGLVVVIYLKRPAGYLYRRDAAYIFVDVETKVEP